ncbi:MAG TPA: sulfurtransferase/chromate resistance protein [Paracoccaceae bacterium]|nr:sulfurtransferase/chromate resistance protein [Paracoccaceae bacterium]
MSSFNMISVEKLSRLIGTPGCPALVDVRDADDFEADPHLVPGARHMTPEVALARAGAFGPRGAVVICKRGQKVSHYVAAWLRQKGVAAECLEGGTEAWAAARLPMVPAAAIPAADSEGRTVWVTRHRPKIDRIACPWLIRRFVDPGAVFLYVPPSEVLAVAERYGATPFDIEGVFWSHRGETCSFDTMIEEFRLATPPLLRLAEIVRGADTARFELAPQAAGLLAASLGLSRMFADDLEQLEAGMTLYDAFYRWCRDAVDETHNWPTPVRA